MTNDIGKIGNFLYQYYRTTKRSQTNDEDDVWRHDDGTIFEIGAQTYLSLSVHTTSSRKPKPDANMIKKNLENILSIKIQQEICMWLMFPLIPLPSPIMAEPVQRTKSKSWEILGSSPPLLSSSCQHNLKMLYTRKPKTIGTSITFETLLHRLARF